MGNEGGKYKYKHIFKGLTFWVGICEAVNMKKALTTMISRSTAEKLRETIRLEGWVFFSHAAVASDKSC